MNNSLPPTVPPVNRSVIATAVVGGILFVVLMALSLPLLILLTLGSVGPNSFERLAPFWITAGILLCVMGLVLPFSLGWLAARATLRKQIKANITPTAKFSALCGLTTTFLAELPFTLCALVSTAPLLIALTNLGVGTLGGYLYFVRFRHRTTIPGKETPLLPAEPQV